MDNPNNSDEANARIAATKERVEKAWANGSVKEQLDYPVDVIDALRLIEELFYLRAPNHKKQKAFWIDGCRQLMDAGGANWRDVLKSYHQEYTQQTMELGRPPFTIASPKSLVNVVRAKEAQLRTPQIEQPMSEMARKEMRARERNKSNE